VKVTAYCPCKLCCGKSDGITSTGVKARPHNTIAVDPAVIPMGSTIYLEGMGTFTAEDTGGAIRGNKVDLFMSEHHQALNFGVKFTRALLLQQPI
jgi:3D (Asp-Asp-Asp) domain-containing protein